MFWFGVSMNAIITLSFLSGETFEPPHDKTNKMTVHPTKNQIHTV